MNLIRIFSFVLLVASICMASFLVLSVKKTIDFRDSISETEGKIIEKLEVIREAEKAYFDQYGKYTASWDSLITFINTGIVPITVRKENVIHLAYGADSIQVKIDTIGTISAKEKIFRQNFTVTAPDNGVFLGYLSANKPGQTTVKGAPSYKMKIGDRTNQYTFMESGTINGVAKIDPGTNINKGQILITLWNNRFNPSLDINSINIVPVSGEQFSITTSKEVRNSIPVTLLEVRDPKPINPERNEKNEAKNKKPLGFGSKTDVGLSGNWE